MKMNERKALFAAPTIALIITTSAGWAAPSYIARTCVDEAGHFARCTIYSTDDGRTHVFYQFECAAADQFGRCPNDPECYDAKGVTSCTGKVAPATAHCIDFSATASSKALIFPRQHLPNPRRRAGRMEACRRGTQNNALMKLGTWPTVPLFKRPTAARKPTMGNVAPLVNLVDVRTIHSAMTHKGMVLDAQAR
jgi:hypothetical protein